MGGKANSSQAAGSAGRAAGGSAGRPIGGSAGRAANAGAAVPIGIVCGLGNPGKEYERTRHNAGFLAIDELARQLGASYWKTKPGALVAEVSLSGARAGDKLVLVKPTSFMNVSGGPLSHIAKEYRVPPAGILVIHDELEIDAGQVRIRMGGGHAGHNGLRSICDKLGTHDFPRVRTGIGRPPGRQAPGDFVLREMRGRDWDDFAITVADAASAARFAVEQGLAASLTRYGGK